MLFTSPPYLTKLTDDIQITNYSKNILESVKKMESDPINITGWLRDSGLSEGFFLGIS